MSKRVLHVDDESLWRQRVRNVLQVSGHYVESFSSLSDARASYESEDYDVVIADGTIDRLGDGLYWAQDLYKEGQRVALLSGGSSDLLILKGIEKSDGWDSELIAFVEAGG